MTQIGLQPVSAPFGEGSRRDPDDAICSNLGDQTRLGPDPSDDTSEGSPFVSPPPLPFPRIFPGL